MACYLTALSRCCFIFNMIERNRYQSIFCGIILTVSNKKYIWKLYFSGVQWVNKLRPSFTQIRHGIGSSLVQVIPCSALSHFLNRCCLIIKNWAEGLMKLPKLFPRKYVWKCCLQTGGHFILASVRPFKQIYCFWNKHSHANISLWPS